MGLRFGNKKIITDSLIWMVDIGNPGSYNGTSTVNDLVGNNNATLVGSQSFATTNGGELTYETGQITNYIRFPEAALNSLTSGAEWTIETWLSINTTSGTTTYLHSQATSSQNNQYLIQRSGSNISAWNETLESGSTMSFTSGTTFCLTIRHSGSSQRYYKNGVFAAQYSAANDISLTQGWVLNQEQDSVLGGFQTTQATPCSFNQCSLYNRPLSDTEIATNFELKRARYNI